MKTILFSFIFCLINVCLNAQAGTLDSSFGVNGIEKSFRGNLAHIALQKDGKFIATGTGSLNTGFLLIRYKQNGSIDSSFGKNGIVITNFPTGDAYSIAVDIAPNDEIVIAGEVYTSRYDNIGLARYKQDGTIDSSFGINGLVSISLGFHISAFVEDMIIQKNNKILLVGNSYNQQNDLTPFMARFDFGGKIDKTFGENGKVFTIFSKPSKFSSIALQDDNKILSGGTYSYLDFASKFMVVRYLNSGIIDSSFGLNGICKVGLDSNSFCQLNSIAVQKNGNIVCGGFNVFSGGSQDIGLVRFKNNGLADSSFNHNGTSIVRLNKWSELTKVLVQDDGKTLGVGNYGIGYPDTSEFLVTRYRRNGELDHSFGKDGGNVVRVGDKCNATDAIIQNDCKILVAGNSYLLKNQRNYFGFARFNNKSAINKPKLHNYADAATLNNNINLYPNPVQNTLTINGLSAINNYQLVINNSKGSVVETKQVSNLSSYQLNVQNVSSGVYYVNVVSNNKIISTLKFVKE